MNLRNETLIKLTTTARARLKLGKKAPATADQTFAKDEAAIEALIREASWQAMVRIMNRAIQYKARTEYHDVIAGQREFWVDGFPIDTNETITVVNNTDVPRVWTNSDDVIDSDYVLCGDTDRRSRRGSIYLETSLAHGPKVLKISYTGGMAPRTLYSGSDGATSDPGASANNRITSAGATFTTWGVAVGDRLLIDGGVNDGVYRITTISSETVLLVSPAFSMPSMLWYSAFSTVSTTGEKWEIMDGGDDTIVKIYPDVANAIDEQVAELYLRQGTRTMRSIQEAGGNLVYVGGYGWLPHVLEILRSEARYGGY